MMGKLKKNIYVYLPNFYFLAFIRIRHLKGLKVERQKLFAIFQSLLIFIHWESKCQTVRYLFKRVFPWLSKTVYIRHAIVV